MNRNRKFEKGMRQFLQNLDENKPINYDDDQIRLYAYECIKREYVDGFYHPGISSTGKVLFDRSGSPKVRKAGYEFMDKQPDWLGVITAIASLVTATGVLLQLVLSYLL